MRALLLVVVFAVCASFAETRTYVGTDGAWSSAANWSPTGVPAVGETARFTASATVSDRVPLEGHVTLDVASGATVTLSGTLHGAGGMVKIGDGTLIVSGNNSFAGDFVVSNGVVYARGWNALGDSAGGCVEIHARDRKTFLYFGGVHVRKDLVLHNCNDVDIGYGTFFRVEAGTTNRVSGALSVPGHYLRMQSYANSRLDFAGGGTFGGNSAFLNRATDAEIRVLEQPMSIVNRYSSDLRNGWLELAVSGCSMIDYTSETQICNGYRRLTVDGALVPSTILNGGTDSKLELSGTTQTITRLFGRDPARPGEVTSERPASLTLTDTTTYTNTCIFKGRVALTLTGASARPVVLTGASTSFGTLTIDAGKTVRFAPGASWRGGVVVKGRLVLEEGTALADASFVDVWDGGSVEGASGTFRQSRRNGISQHVGTRRDYVGTDGRWTRAANWSPAGVPGSGDTVRFNASTTLDESFDLPGGVTRIEEASGVEVTLKGAIGGAEATLVHAGASSGTLVLSGTNTFTGAFTNLSGTVKVPWLADAGRPSPIGAGCGPLAKIYNNGVFWVMGATATDRPYQGGSSAQWNVETSLQLNGPVSGKTWWRREGEIVVNAPCPDISTFSRTDGGRVHMRCPTNTFAVTVEFSAGTLYASTLANRGLPSSIGRGTAMRFSQSSYPTPSTLAYEGVQDACCDRDIQINSFNDKTAGYTASFARHDGLTFQGCRAGVKATYSGALTLGNDDAVHPFICCAGPGDTELVASIPHRFHLYKSGSGTWTLAGNNAATGTCEVAAGRVDVRGALAAGMTPSVDAGATLGGDGILHGGARLAAGATLAAGTATSCGTLTVEGTLSLAADARLWFKVGDDACDCIQTMGALALPEEITVELVAWNGGRIADGAYPLLRWTTMPSTRFTTTGLRGCRLEKTADALMLVVSRQEDFHTATRSTEEPLVVAVDPGETIAAAKERVRGILGGGSSGGRPVTVLLPPGDYVVEAALAFTAADSGTPSAPIVWKAARRGTVRILGARPLDAARFRSLASDDPMCARLPSGVASSVLAADVSDRLPATLPAWGAQFRTPPAPWLFLGGRFQELARWPNRVSEAEHGWTTFTQCTSVGASDKTGITFVTADTRAARWNFTEGVWLYGYWGQTWDENFVKAQGWNAGTRELTLSGKPNYVPTLGAQSVARKYVAVNLPEELDAPGEWWLDRGARRLYYIPPEAFGADELVLNAYSGRLVSFAAGTHDVSFENITFAYAGAAFAADGDVARIAFDGCDFLSLMNTSSLTGSGCSVRRSSFAHLGQGGVTLNGGNRINLVRALNVVEDCDFTDFERCQQTYTPAVSLQGCGSAMRNCRAGESAHEAVTYGGNEHFVGWCDFFRVLRESEDCGAIYTGRNTSTLGTQLVGNSFHDMDTGDVTGIYFDDCDWGDDAIGNTFENVYRAFMVGGGNLHRLQWNQMRNGTSGLHVDRRGYTWQGRSDWVTGDDWCFRSFTSAGIDPSSSIWSAAYPSLVENLYDSPREPWNNVYRGNLIQDYTTWTTLQRTATQSSYYPSIDRMEIADNVTASTHGKSGTGLPGFTHLARAATEDDVPGMRDGLARVAALAEAPVTTVSSPDGVLRVRVGLDVTARLCCRADWNGEEVLSLSPMGVTVDGTDYGRMRRPGSASLRTVSGEKAVDAAASLGYVEAVIPLEAVVDGDTSAQVEVRVFNEGFAYRLRVAGTGTREVSGEFAQWRMSEVGGLTGTAIPATGWTCTGEVLTPWNVARQTPAAITNGVLFIDVPTGESRALTIAERAALTSDIVTDAVKTGGGTLQLASALTGYTGTWGVSNGFIAVSAPLDAFGTGGEGVVHIVDRSGSNGYALTLSGNVVVDRPIELVCADYRTMQVAAYAQVRFLRRVTCSGSLARVSYEANSRTVYAGGLVHRATIFAINGSGEQVFEGVPSNLMWLYAQGSVTTRFNCPSNRMDTITCAFSSGGRIVLGCEDALAGNTAMKQDDTANYVIDLAGHDLTTGLFTRFTSGEITSSSPAWWRFAQSARVTNATCAVTGLLTLWKTGAAEFAVARQIDSRGGLIVDQGIFRMTSAASWPNVAFIDVSGTGRLIVEGGEVFDEVPFVRVSGGGVIQVPSGVTLNCGALKVNGRFLAAGDYTSASGFISGGGVLHAGPPPGTLFLVR